MKELSNSKMCMVCELGVNWVIAISDNNKHSDFFSAFTFALSTCGILLSIVALVLLLLTALLFSEWRKIYKNQVLVQFMVARFSYSSVRYVYDVTQLFNIRSYFHPIYLDAIPLAYTEMVLVTWMCIFSKLMYESFVKVFNIGTPSLLKLSLAAWLIPGIVAGILFAGYNLQDGLDVIFFVLYLFLLKWPVLCANGVFLVLVLKNIITTNKSKTENNPRIVLMMIILIFTFCFQQLISDIYKLVYVTFKFKYSVPYTPIMFVFINIITVYHCAFSILFWLFANKRTRVLWGFTKENSKDDTKSNASNDTNIIKY